jgi:hypothetical protein
MSIGNNPRVVVLVALPQGDDYSFAFLLSNENQGVFFLVYIRILVAGLQGQNK